MFFLLKLVTKIYLSSKSNKNKTFRTNAYVNYDISLDFSWVQKSLTNKS